MIHYHNNYSLFLCFPTFWARIRRWVSRWLADRSSLWQGTFKWLVSIRPPICYTPTRTVLFLEQYVPNRFVWQFGYHPPHLGHMGNLIDGARPWRYFITRCRETQFFMPQQALKFLLSLGFCQWYHSSNSSLLEFQINASILKMISTGMKQKVWPKVTITRFYGFDDNKTYVVICTNFPVAKFILGF